MTQEQPKHLIYGYFSVPIFKIRIGNFYFEISKIRKEYSTFKELAIDIEKLLEKPKKNE